MIFEILKYIEHIFYQKIWAVNFMDRKCIFLEPKKPRKHRLCTKSGKLTLLP